MNARFTLLLLLGACAQSDRMVGPPAFQIMGDEPTAIDFITYDATSLALHTLVNEGIVTAAREGGVPFSIVVSLTLEDEDGNSEPLDELVSPLVFFKPIGPAVEGRFAGILSAPWDGKLNGVDPVWPVTAAYSAGVVLVLPNGRERLIGTWTSGRLVVDLQAP